MPDVRFDRYYRYEDLTRIVVTTRVELAGGVERG